MKTLLYVTLIMVLAVPACQMEDTIAPQLSTTEALAQHDLQILADQDVTSFDLGNCKEVRTDYFLIGKPDWVVSDYSTEPQYVLTAYGEAWLNEKEVGRSVLTLNIDPIRKTYAGNLEAIFSNQVIVHRFAGSITDAPDVSADPVKDLAFNGQADVINGYLATELVTLLLRDGGSCKLAVKPTDEGLTEVHISVIGTYCGFQGFSTRK